MQDLELITKIQRQLKQLYQNIGDSMISGGVDNMEKYKYMLGQAHAYEYISQEISNLLNKKEQKEMNKEPSSISIRTTRSQSIKTL